MPAIWSRNRCAHCQLFQGPVAESARLKRRGQPGPHARQCFVRGVLLNGRFRGTLRKHNMSTCSFLSVRGCFSSRQSAARQLNLCRSGSLNYLGPPVVIRLLEERSADDSVVFAGCIVSKVKCGLADPTLRGLPQVALSQ